MSTHWNAETRDHHRLLWCQHCAFYRIEMGGVVSHTLAGRHVRHSKGHEVVVINLVTLTIEHRYQMVIPDQLEIPPF